MFIFEWHLIKKTKINNNNNNNKWRPDSLFIALVTLCWRGFGQNEVEWSRKLEVRGTESMGVAGKIGRYILAHSRLKRETFDTHGLLAEGTVRICETTAWNNSGMNMPSLNGQIENTNLQKQQQQHQKVKAWLTLHSTCHTTMFEEDWDKMKLNEAGSWKLEAQNPQE